MTDLYTDVAEDALMNEGEEGAQKPHGRKAKPRKTAYEVAARYLATRMRTEAEVRNHLRDKDYQDEEINPVIEELTNHRYLDDEHYVMTYAEYAFGKGRGSRRIANELLQKGIRKEIIDNAIEDFKYENHISERAIAYDVARHTAQLELEGRDREFDKKLRAKLARKLDQRGFDTGMIFGILSELEGELGRADEEYL